MHGLIGILAASALSIAALGCGSGTQGGNTGGGGTGGSAGHGGAGGDTSHGSTGGSTGDGGAGGSTTTGGNTLEPTFANVFDEVFKPGGCTSGACHYGVGFSLDSKEKAHTALVSVPASSGGCGDAVRVVPGDPDKSLLYLKVSMPAPPCGERMPLNAAPLDASQIALLRAWIEAGAGSE